MFPKMAADQYRPQGRYQHSHLRSGRRTGIVRVARWRDDTIPTGWSGSERSPSHWLPLPLPPDPAKAASTSAMAAAMESHSGASLATGVSQ